MIDSQTRRWWRPLRPEEEHVQFAPIEDKLNATVTKFTSTLRRILLVAEDDIIKKALGIKDNRDWIQLKQLTVAGGLEEYRRSIKDHLNNIYNFVKASTAAEYGVILPATTPGFVKWMESQSRILTELHGSVLDSRIRRSVLGSSPIDVEVRIRRVFAEFSENEIEKGGDLLAVLSMQAAREDVVSERAVDVVSWEWSAILDHKTCPVCMELDGIVWEVGDPTIIRPPIHFRCRCLLVGTLREAVYKPTITGLPFEFALPDANKRFVATLGGYNAG